MRLIDMHCDTISLLVQEDDVNLEKNPFGVNLRQNPFCVDLEKMKKAGSMAQFFACFINMKKFMEANDCSRLVGDDCLRMKSEVCTQAYKSALHMIDRAQKEFAENADLISLTTNYEELIRNAENGKMSAFLTVEEGGILDGNRNRLDHLYEKGVRLMTLLWNGENGIGYPNSRDAQIMNNGLKKFGFETVERMNELGMIVDVSHLSDGGFWDVVKHSEKPVVASHSNARVLCPHPRNLTDEMIRALAEKGGIAGLNLYPYFLNESGKAGIDDMVRHIEHMYYVGGEEFVALGTDFDGFDDGELEFKNIGEMNGLYEALKKRKFNDSQIEKFWSGNALRVIREVL
ncbi:MAG: dipeptidase [Tyzzerella sp.]|nr:dipeptidase [Tyzzerella sp.]